jgi:hypothetical protein
MHDDEVGTDAALMRALLAGQLTEVLAQLQLAR